MTNRKFIKVLNLVSFLVMIGINVLAMFDLIGYSTKEISDSIPSLLMPIGLTFSIVWTIIYIFLAIYSIYQLIAKDRTISKEVDVYFLASNLLNILWIITFHSRMFLFSTLVIILLLIDLYLIVKELRYSTMIPKTTFSIYFGWITVATMVSLFSYISSLFPNLYDSVTLRVLTSLALVVLMLITFIRSKDYPYVLTIIVAMFGVLLKHLIDFNGMYLDVVFVNIIGLTLTCIVAIINMTKENNSYAHKIIEGNI